MGEHSNKVAVVTGASAGIGAATAAALAQAGYTVFGTSRREGAPGPRGVTMMACDVTDADSIDRLVEDIVAQAGRIDLLVNNAGLGLFGAAEESSLNQVKQLFEVNFFGLVRVTNAVLPVMKKNGPRGGRIINISSVLGIIPAPFSAFYSASKHAVEGYSESLDHETRGLNVRVSLIEPAFTKSTFDQSALKPDKTLPDYAAARAHMNRLIEEVMETADPPEVVAETVLLAARAADPKRRYAAGATARQTSFGRRFMPATVFDKILRKQFRLH